MDPWSPLTGTSKTQSPGGQIESARRSATVFAVTGIPCSISTGVSPVQPPRHLRTSSRVLGVYLIVVSASFDLLIKDKGLCSSSGSLAMLAAMRRASSRASNLAAERRPGSSSK